VEKALLEENQTTRKIKMMTMVKARVDLVSWMEYGLITSS
jgi:hypothetical protein